MTMNHSSRRDMLKSTLALAGLGLAGIPEWVLPALAQGETVVPFLERMKRLNYSPSNLPSNYRVEE